MAQAVAAAATPEALANVDIATSTETYLRQRKAEAERVPPEDAASRQLGGIGPGAMADKLFNESMEPLIHKVRGDLQREVALDEVRVPPDLDRGLRVL